MSNLGGITPGARGRPKAWPGCSSHGHLLGFRSWAWGRWPDRRNRGEPAFLAYGQILVHGRVEPGSHFRLGPGEKRAKTLFACAHDHTFPACAHPHTHHSGSHDTSGNSCPRSLRNLTRVRTALGRFTCRWLVCTPMDEPNPASGCTGLQNLCQSGMVRNNRTVHDWPSGRRFTDRAQASRRCVLQVSTSISPPADLAGLGDSLRWRAGPG